MVVCSYWSLVAGVGSLCFFLSVLGREARSLQALAMDAVSKTAATAAKVRVRRIAVLVNAHSDAKQRVRTRETWSLAKTVLGNTNTMYMVTEESRLRNKMSSTRNSGAMTIVENSEDLESIPYELQGDEELSTDKAIAVRAKMRRHPRVLEQLQMWWATAQHTMRVWHGENYDAAVLTRNDYVRIMVLVAKAMSDVFDAEEAQQCAEEDFVEDAKGATTMSQKQFMNAVFELTDLYTRTLDYEEYTGFMQRLLKDVAVPSLNGRHFTFKDQFDVAYGGYEGEEDGEDESPKPQDEQVEDCRSTALRIEVDQPPAASVQDGQHVVKQLNQARDDGGTGSTPSDLPSPSRPRAPLGTPEAARPRNRNDEPLARVQEVNEDNAEESNIAEDPPAARATSFRPTAARQAKAEEAPRVAETGTSEARAGGAAVSTHARKAAARPSPTKPRDPLPRERRQKPHREPAPPAPREPHLELELLVTSLLRVLFLAVEWLGAANASAGSGYFSQLEADPVVEPFVSWAFNELATSTELKTNLQGSWALAPAMQPLAWLDETCPGAQHSNRTRLRYLMELLGHRITILLKALEPVKKARGALTEAEDPDVAAARKLHALIHQPPFAWTMIFDGLNEDRSLAQGHVWKKAVCEVHRRLDWLRSRFAPMTIKPLGSPGTASTPQRPLAPTSPIGDSDEEQSTDPLAGSTSLLSKLNILTTSPTLSLRGQSPRCAGVREEDSLSGSTSLLRHLDSDGAAPTLEQALQQNIAVGGSWQEVISSIDEVSILPPVERTKAAVASIPYVSQMREASWHAPEELLYLSHMRTIAERVGFDSTSLGVAMKCEKELCSAPEWRPLPSPKKDGQSEQVTFPRLPKHGCLPYTGRHTSEQQSSILTTSMSMPAIKSQAQTRSGSVAVASLKKPSGPGDALPARMSLKQVRECLEQLKWLRGVGTRDLRLLTQKVYVNQHQVPKFGRIFLEGQPGDRLFIITRGLVRLTGSGSNIKHSRDVKPTGSFGESAVVMPGIRNATAVALVPSLLLTLSHSELHNRSPSARPTAPAAGTSPAALGREEPLPFYPHELHLALMNTLVSCLMRDSLFVPSSNKVQPSELLKAEFHAVSKSVTEHESLLDYAQSTQMELLAPAALEQMANKYSKRTRQSMQIVSSSLQADALAVLPADESTLVELRNNMAAAPKITVDEYVAAGQLDLLQMAERRLESGENRSFWRSDLSSASWDTILPVGRISSRPPGTPPKHLMNVRTREERLNADAMTTVAERTERAIRQCERNVEAHLGKLSTHGWERTEEIQNAMSKSGQAEMARFVQLMHQRDGKREDAVKAKYLRMPTPKRNSTSTSTQKARPG